jgi:hypothetical protein
MVRTRTPSTLRAWLLALTLMLVLSLLPARWLVGWTAEVADFANVALTPSKHALSSLRHWLRPVPDPMDAAPEAVRELEEQLELARRYYKGLEIEREMLLERIALLERAKQRSGAGDATRTLFGTVVGTTPPRARSAGSLQLNIGAMHTVMPGMIATWEGDILVGRVADSVQRFSSSVIPATALPGFTVQFFPPDGSLSARDAPRGVLASRGDSWTVDLTQPGDVAVGWLVLVAEERWPRASLGLRVGLVESVQVRDDAPLMRRITVQPFVDPFRVPHVVLTDERGLDAASEAKSDGGPNAGGAR